MRTMEILSSIAVAIDKVINLSGVLNGVHVVYYCGYSSLMISGSGSQSLGLTSYHRCTVYSHSASLCQALKFNLCVGGGRGLLKVGIVRGQHTQGD